MVILFLFDSGKPVTGGITRYFGGSAVQVKGQPADQRASFGLGGRIQVVSDQPLLHEGIDGVADFG